MKKKKKDLAIIYVKIAECITQYFYSGETNPAASIDFIKY